MRNILLASVAVATLLGAGCADRPVYRADAPITTTEGVTVAVVGQKCDRRTRRDMNDVLDLVVQARLTNNGAAPVTMNRRFRGTAGGGSASRP